MRDQVGEDVMKLTNAEFSMHCAHIASFAASWAGDSLILPEEYSETPRAGTVALFTDDVRKRLDYLDKLAGRSALTQGE